MRIDDVLTILYNSPNKKVALIAPDEKEARLLMHRFILSAKLPNHASCVQNTILFDKHCLEFLTPHQSMNSGASYFIVEFAENIPEPALNEITPDMCCGEIK